MTPLVKPQPHAAATAITDSARDVRGALRRLEVGVARAVHGKPEVIALALSALAARGHLLIEDVPGVGKTTLARALARSVGGTFRRIQFTSDLLPSDILGVSVWQADRNGFEFKPGPIFANVVLADEINRTTPRTQSSLLESMSDGKVSVDGATHTLPSPFLVIATQNPLEHFGTYPLPESQMDRFLLRVRMGYPDPAAERRVVTARGGKDDVDELPAVVELGDVQAIQAAATAVRVEDSLLAYAERVVLETRGSPFLALGVSTRGFQGWYRAAQGRALVAGREFCVPDDFKALALPALAHRVVLSQSGSGELGRTREEAERVLSDLLERVPVPT